MYACIIRETFVFKVFRRVFHSILKLELCRQSCRRRNQIIPTCRYGKNMPTTALVISSANEDGKAYDVRNNYMQDIMSHTQSSFLLSQQSLLSEQH